MADDRIRVNVKGIDAPVFFPADYTPEKIQFAIENDILPKMGKPKRDFGVLEKPWGTGVVEGLNKAATWVGENVNEQAAKVLPEKGAAALGAAANAVVQVGPGAMGGASIGKAAAPLVEGAARGLMKSAIKPVLPDQRSGKAAKAIETMLTEDAGGMLKGVNPTEGGVDTLMRKVSELKAAQKAITDASKKTGDADKIVRSLDDFKAGLEQGTMHSEGVATADRVAREFLTNPNIVRATGGIAQPGGAGRAPIDVLQAMKEANYRTLGDSAYGRGLKPAAERDALKTLTAEIRSEIQAAEPGVISLDAKMSELLNAKKIAERRAMMEGNKNPASLGLSIATAAHSSLAAAGLWANSSALAKSIIARIMFQGSEAIPATAGAATGGTLGALLGRPDDKRNR